MKKNYFEPTVEVISINTAYPLAISFGGDAGNDIEDGGNAGGGLSGDAKSREDEEAYVATGGAGASSYGDLW